MPQNIIGQSRDRSGITSRNRFFAQSEQLLRNLFARSQCILIGKSQIEPGLSRTAQPYSVQSPAHARIGTIPVRYNPDPAAQFPLRILLPDPAAGIEEVRRHAGSILFPYPACRYRTNPGIDCHIARGETGPLQQPGYPGGYGGLAPITAGIALLISQSDQHSRAITCGQRYAAHELFVPVGKRQRTDQRLSLYALHPGFQRFPIGRKNRYRHTGRFGRRHRNIKQIAYGCGSCTHRVIDTNGRQRRAGFNRGTHCISGGFIPFIPDRNRKFRRYRRIGLQSDRQRFRSGRDTQRFESAQ